MLFKSSFITVMAFSAGFFALFTDIETGSQPELSIGNLKGHQPPFNQIEFRLPPTFQLPSRQDWEPTPSSWYLGTWYLTHSSSLPYQTFQNMQWSLYPTETWAIDGTLQDLVSVFALNETFVFKNYGIDNPTVINGQPITDSYHYIPTAPLAYLNNTWEVISWGYDTEGVPFSAVYETPADAGLVAPCFDITSWSDKGPSQATLSAIYSGISNLHNDALTTMLQHVVKLTQNGGRNGELYPSCNSTCQANADAYGIALGTGGVLS